MVNGEDEFEEDAWEEKEETKVKVKVSAKSRSTYATLDTAATNVWMSLASFQHGGRQFVPASRGAVSADGSDLDVVGKGVISFVIWGRRFEDVPVRVMRNLTGGWLIGRRWMLQVGLILDFAKGRGYLKCLLRKVY